MSTYATIIFAFVFALLSAFVSIRFYLNTKKNTVRLPRTALGNGIQIISQQVIVLSIVVIFGVVGEIDLYDLGASRTFHPLGAFVIGFVVYFIVLSLIEALAIGFGIRDRLHDLSFETMRLIWPRDRNQKLLAIVAVCLINPFTEEVIYRGVLIHFLGGFTENLVMAVLIGFVLSITAHMYQGAWSIPFQMMFHGTAVLLLLSPFGLVACFGFHFAGDLVPVISMRKSMIEWRERRRRERALAV